MTDSRIIVTVVGHPSSGKDTVAAYLVERYGFRHVSTADYVRFYIAEHGLGEPTRPLMHDVANRLRHENGADYLARMALQTPADRLVISAPRVPDDIHLIKQHGGVAITVTAPQELRYQRSKERGRIGDGVSFEQFKDIEAQEASNPDPASQNVTAVIALADDEVNNEGSLERLYQEVDAVLEKRFSLAPVEGR